MSGIGQRTGNSRQAAAIFKLGHLSKTSRRTISLRLPDAFCGTIHPRLMKDQLRLSKKRQFRIDTNRRVLDDRDTPLLWGGTAPICRDDLPDG
jgi:hypothetical protein